MPGSARALSLPGLSSRPTWRPCASLAPLALLLTAIAACGGGNEQSAPESQQPPDLFSGDGDDNDSGSAGDDDDDDAVGNECLAGSSAYADGETPGEQAFGCAIQPAGYIPPPGSAPCISPQSWRCERAARCAGKGFNYDIDWAICASFASRTSRCDDESADARAKAVAESIRADLSETTSLDTSGIEQTIGEMESCLRDHLNLDMQCGTERRWRGICYGAALANAGDIRSSRPKAGTSGGYCRPDASCDAGLVCSIDGECLPHGAAGDGCGAVSSLHPQLACDPEHEVYCLKDPFTSKKQCQAYPHDLDVGDECIESGCPRGAACAYTCRAVVFSGQPCSDEANVCLQGPWNAGSVDGFAYGTCRLSDDAQSNVCRDYE